MDTVRYLGRYIPIPTVRFWISGTYEMSRYGVLQKRGDIDGHGGEHTGPYTCPSVDRVYVKTLGSEDNEQLTGAFPVFLHVSVLPYLLYTRWSSREEKRMGRQADAAKFGWVSRSDVASGRC